MDALLEYISTLLVAYGPRLVFLITMIETAAFIGLFVPAEATVLLAAFLAERGVLDLAEVSLATFLGGLAGDQIGYALGRFGGRRVVREGGRLGRVWRKYERATAGLFRRHSVVAVSIARFISFVRTLMPWFAGMSGMGYGRFLAYDLIGVAGWAAASIAVGYAAGESWALVAEWLGRAAAAILIGLLLVAFLVARRRRKLVGAVVDLGEG